MPRKRRQSGNKSLLQSPATEPSRMSPRTKSPKTSWVIRKKRTSFSDSCCILSDCLPGFVAFASPRYPCTALPIFPSMTILISPVTPASPRLASPPLLPLESDADCAFTQRHASSCLLGANRTFFRFLCAPLVSTKPSSEHSKC